MRLAVFIRESNLVMEGLYSGPGPELTFRVAGSRASSRGGWS